MKSEIANRKSEIEAHYLPRIAAARAAAEERRDEAWLDVPHDLCGLPTRAMTLADYLALHAAGNAHLCDHPEPANAAAFWALHDGVLLWRLSLDYQPATEARAKFAQRLRAADIGAMHEAIIVYIRDLFADRPKNIQREDEKAHAPIVLPASFAACWIHDFGQAYGWPPTTTLAMPLPQIFQLRQLLKFEATLKAGQRPMPTDEADVLAARCFAEIAALEP